MARAMRKREQQLRHEWYCGNVGVVTWRDPDKAASNFKHTVTYTGSFVGHGLHGLLGGRTLIFVANET
ncbi:hypothetical protein E1B28_002859 [Marasmius oreades]|uniref:Uncharacterized protein n=1 Tax=Marasmius oreades TaxID=181124 RepID=A0A9P7ULC3_9AGAR|nr:uncharacterized protein E1B28_002859 [Marasmius oreades]KAG7086942.1 hypothetical protein E1B28_002859 [Marasmius oreades]